MYHEQTRGRAHACGLGRGRDTRRTAPEKTALWGVSLYLVPYDLFESFIFGTLFLDDVGVFDSHLSACRDVETPRGEE
jgi:hypothetical protein